VGQLALAFPTHKHVVCYSGGHSSALVAIEVVRRYGPDGVVLLNHDINGRVEDADVKRFKREVAAALGLPITYASHPRWEEWDQFDVVRDAQAFKVRNGEELCTSRLKTEPFRRWLKANTDPRNTTVYYGFDANEPHRITRRAGILGAQGYRTAYPRASWRHTIESTREIGIEPPLTYAQWKHGNCKGCLKAGWQHWYVVFCEEPEIYQRGIEAEDDIGYTIHADGSLRDRAPQFAAMRDAGILPTEHTPRGEFWSAARKAVRSLPVLAEERDARPCECVFKKPRRGQRWQPQCDCEALPGEGHALHCARVWGEQEAA
jgi:hypothetical protein